MFGIMQKTGLSFLLVLTSLSISAQVVLSDLEFHQPRELDSIFTRSYGWKTILLDKEAFIGVWNQQMDWVDEYFIDGVVYYAQENKDGVWRESPVYPKTRVEYLNPIFQTTQTRSMLFGWSFDAKKDVLVVGAPGFSIYNGSNLVYGRGAVFTFKRDPLGIWHENSVLIDSTQTAGGFQGRRVLLANDQLLVYSETNDGGDFYNSTITVYETENEHWHKVQQLAPLGDSVKYDMFGLNMAANDKYLVIFSSKVINDLVQPRIAYNTMWFYEYDLTSKQWRYQSQLIDTSRWFISEASTIKFYDDELYVGDFYDDGTLSGKPKLPYEGAVFVYNKTSQNTWESSQIVKSARRYPHYFGQTFYKHNNMLFVSASGHEYDAHNSAKKKGAGAFYVFKRDEIGAWSEFAKVVAPDRDTSQNFGILSGFENKIMVTAPSRSTTRHYKNPVYPFQTLHHFGPSVFYTMQYDTIVNSFDDFKMFPNPSSTFVRIELDAFVSYARVQLFSIQGQLIASTEISNSYFAELDLSSLTVGVYIVKVVLPDKFASKKIIKH